MGYANRCQACGAVAPTKYVDFKQNIGMLVARRSSQVTGNLCKPCVHKHFWKTTGTTLAVGWLGQISVFIAPVFVINNVVRYVGCLGMPGPDAGKGRAFEVVPSAAPVAALPVRGAPPRMSAVPSLADSGPIPFDDEEPIELLPDAIDPATVLQPYWAPMVARIKAKEPLAAVAADVANETGLTAEQVSTYVINRVNKAKAAKQAAATAV